MATSTAAPVATTRMLHRPVRTGRAYWGPGDQYTFLVTGAESGGAYFAMEALVPPGGGPPPHIHRREDEAFYVLEGQIEFLLGDKRVTAGPGDFVNVPHGNVHCFHNSGTDMARLLLTFTPAGIEGFFEESLEPARPGEEIPTDNIDEVVARYIAVAPRFGLEFV
jgi:quercetin dioxygenase-like cupin family protein